MSGSVLYSGVRIDCIIPFSQYADTDTVLIPESVTQDGKTFIDRVLAPLGVIQPVDLKDDNADTVRQMNNG